MKVLVVEDDASFRDMLRAFLENDGHQVVTVSTGQEALAELKRKGTDFAILDIGLPDISGLVLYNEIKETYPDLAGKVIFLTGLPLLRKAVERMADLGVVFLPKPVDASTLAGAMRVARAGAG